VGNEELRREALRINQRYLSELVEALGLCPWAKTVRDGAGLRRTVLFGEVKSTGLLDEAYAELEDIAGDESVDIGLLIFPTLQIESSEFRRLVAELESRHASQYERGCTPLAMASFHPDAIVDTSAAARLVPFIRRSPDPTIQLVRRAAMDRVRQTEDEGSVFVDNLASFMPMLGSRPKASVSDGIAKANLHTVLKIGVEEIEKIIDEIQRDRSTAYARAAKHG